MLLMIVFATVMVSLIALIGIVTISLKKGLVEKIVFALVALSVGALLGDAFLHLIPEAALSISLERVFVYVLIGFVLFLLIERILHWRHCHEGDCPIHVFAYMNLVGDGVHNFIDGLIIAGSFMISPVVGLASTLAIILHEVPQELGDFGVMIHAGFSKGRAIVLNLLTALTAVVGGVVGFFLFNYVDNVLPFLLSIAAGGFIYVAASDLIPEMRKRHFSKTWIDLFMIIVGLGIMWVLGFVG